MKALLFLVCSVFLIQACSQVRVQRLKNPETGHIVECSGPARLPGVVDVNRCIFDYQEKGYELFHH